jgi:RNA polymerase sigma factor (sigma-70 family)
VVTEDGNSFWPQTEVGLINRLGDAGDNAAWTAFVERYRPSICRTARREGLSEDEAAEVLQSALIAVHRSLAAYDPARCKFRTWLGGIVRHRIHEQIRLRPRGEPLKGPVSAETTTCCERVEPGLRVEPFAPFEAEEERELDARAWERLKRQIPPEHWQVLYDLVARGHSPAAVAKKYGRPRGTVYVIKLRCLPKLRAVRRQLEIEEELGLLGANAAKQAAAAPPGPPGPTGR